MAHGVQNFVLFTFLILLMPLLATGRIENWKVHKIAKFFYDRHLVMQFSSKQLTYLSELSLLVDKRCSSLWPTLSMFSTGILTTFRLDSMWASTAFLAMPTSSAKSLALRSSRISSNRVNRSLLCQRKSSKVWKFKKSKIINYIMQF